MTERLIFARRSALDIYDVTPGMIIEPPEGDDILRILVPDGSFRSAVIDRPTPAGAPTIEGETKVGSLLQLATRGVWNGTPPPTFSYQWVVNDEELPGEIDTIFDTHRTRGRRHCSVERVR